MTVISKHVNSFQLGHREDNCTIQPYKKPREIGTCSIKLIMMGLVVFLIVKMLASEMQGREKSFQFVSKD